MSNANESKSTASAVLPVSPGLVAGLKPKGACWYCNQPLDNVRRFCSKHCAEDYLLEEEGFNNRSP